jgi:hypothetical protein
LLNPASAKRSHFFEAFARFVRSEPSKAAYGIRCKQPGVNCLFLDAATRVLLVVFVAWRQPAAVRCFFETFQSASAPQGSGFRVQGRGNLPDLLKHFLS